MTELSASPSTTSFCTYCGQQNDGTMQSCAGCGSKQGGGVKRVSTLRPAPTRAAMAPAQPLDQRHLGQWNWGAALLYPYWLLAHRKPLAGAIWLALTVATGTIVPFIFPLLLIAFAYYGLNANKIAFASGRYDDEREFVAVQNAWRNWAIGITIVEIAAIAYVMLSSLAPA